MKKIEAERIAELGHNLAEHMTRKYGGLIAAQTGSLVVGRSARVDFSKGLKRGRLKEMPKETFLVKPGDPHNLARLTSPDGIGRTFGIMSQTGLLTEEKIVSTGIITDRTRPGELHITPLTGGGGVPLGRFTGADTIGRIMTETGLLIQHPQAGTAEADSRYGTAGEIGHAMQGLSALTDPSILAALHRGEEHIVHQWSSGHSTRGKNVAAPGIGAALTNRDSGISALTVMTDNGPVQNGFGPELLIIENDSRFVLVDHVAITDQTESSRLGVSPSELATGIALLAAESQLERSGITLETQVMQTMELI